MGSSAAIGVLIAIFGYFVGLPLLGWLLGL